MIKAFIFDMDGLLIDSEPFWRQAQIASFKSVGITVTSKEMEATMGRRIDEVVAHWYNLSPWQGPSQKDIEALIVDRVIELIKSEGKARAGVVKTLKMLQELNYPIVIASSSPSEIIETVIQVLELDRFFNFYYSAEHESHGKPHPGVFITAAAKLGVMPHNCLVFEDSPSGVLAAKSAQMKCVAVPDRTSSKHSFIQTADAVIDSLDDFNSDLLKTLNV